MVLIAEGKIAKSNYPNTPAVRLLRSRNITFKPHTYAYVDHGGAGQAADALHVAAYTVIKTLVMETQDRLSILMLMHGNRTVSTRQLARAIGVKSVNPVAPEKALRLTGYQVGGISPFGTRRTMPVFAQCTIFDLRSILINGGKRGFLVEIDPVVLLKNLSIRTVDVVVPE